MRELDALLHQGLAALKMQPPKGTAEALLEYIGLLCKWNKVYNLTSVRDPAAMVQKHILDSLTVLPFLCPGRAIDVGTGAGLPGVPLALLEPEREWVLLDSNGKKTRFLHEVRRVLSLPNVRIKTARVERFSDPKRFSNVITRAFASLSEMLSMTHQLCLPEGQFISLKGEYPIAELEMIPEDFHITSIEPVSVPTLNVKRHLVIIRPK